ncbi:3-oxoacyl-[acyl-carrier-protein] synthase II [Galdieria sulphuraria]|uniref:3-oxoacyl-[acyl-carrier-protein] synthase I, chloroplastic n=1 Tax=Galdieria sulphuraria TaxID=130081 RepID=M2W6Q5_GALSU|nr:3-oxoacyl-[acyl-carrier-protein] synthase II [Galdieria sulphuraria]EME31466.1 3-oxoacyl-[acyl-carrier-protein] synthase II [Galdieria sulphuraria]|eukprot:XP_005707986.1 3-oxoacyl-[acyl-carrier-protein] synthase II [Galdieria sulphuraria]
MIDSSCTWKTNYLAAFQIQVTFSKQSRTLQRKYGLRIGNLRCRKNFAGLKMQTYYRDNGKDGPRKRVVVTGMGVVSCFGTDVDLFYDNLLAGKSGIKRIEKFPVDEYSTKIGGEITPENFQANKYLSPKLARRMDPVICYSVAASKLALDHAGVAIGSESFSKLRKERCGVIIGSGMGGLISFTDGVGKLLADEFDRISPFFIPNSICNLGSAMVAIETGFMGPNYSISSACATSNHAINNAAMHIQRGEAEMIVTGGSEAALTPIGLTGFIACRALSKRNEDPTKACRPWDTERDGFVMGEGCGVLVLESLEHALRREAPILCEYLGGAHTCDAYHITEPHPEGHGVIKCMELAVQDSGINIADVDYINAHATSTPLGDIAEFRAIRSIFKDYKDRVKLNSTKSLIGHGLGAAGALEAIATVKAIQTGKLHPTLNVEKLDPEVDMDVVPNVAKEHRVRVAMSNSFGFGGHNSVVVFGAYDQ